MTASFRGCHLGQSGKSTSRSVRNLLPNGGVDQTPHGCGRPVASSGVIRRLPHPLTTAIAGVVTGLLVAVVPALDAYAHVSVSSPDATPGGFGKVVFRVPNESTTANTTAITVQIPADTPFPEVSVGAMPGWTATTTTSPLPEPVEVEGFTITEAVSSVTWTADGDGLPPEQFAEFQLSVGPFPEASTRSCSRPPRPTPTARWSSGPIRQWKGRTNRTTQRPCWRSPPPVTATTAPRAAPTASPGALGIAGVALGAAGLAMGLSARQARRRDA